MHTDGGEFCSNNFRDWFRIALDSRIAHQVTPPYTLQLNGVAESSSRTIVVSARSQIYAKKVPLELTKVPNLNFGVWKFNALLTFGTGQRSAPKNLTPHEHWYKKKADISHLKVFGCRVFAHMTDEKRKKLDLKAVGMMAGYQEGSMSCYNLRLHNPGFFIFLCLNNFICLSVTDHAAKKFIIRDVVFEEESMMMLE